MNDGDVRMHDGPRAERSRAVVIHVAAADPARSTESPRFVVSAEADSVKL
jgi:hypothetical protein